MPLISAIVPVYKVEQYIHRCLDSILSQTFTDFELILIDDGSPDHCPAICDEYAEKDHRVHVIHQKNSGLSAARNTGIDWVLANSDSQWITFIDSDDWIHSRMFETLYKAAVENGVEISACGFEQTEGNEPETDANPLSAEIWSAEEFYALHTTNATIACAKLYNKSCFSQIRYPVGKLHEDEFTTYKILFAQQELAVVFEPLYYYYHNSNSITTSAWTPRRMEVIQAFDEQLSFFAKSGFTIAMKRRVRSYFWMLCSQYYGACSAPQSYPREIKQIKQQMRKIMREYDGQIDQSWPEYIAAYELAYPVLNKIQTFLSGKNLRNTHDKQKL